MMQTKIIKIDAKKPQQSKLLLAASIIRKGGLVAFPTETVYGLGADALEGNCVKKIFKAKGRPQDNPLIVHIADVNDVKRLTTKIPKSAELLMQHFWPGPLTIVLKKSKLVPSEVTAGLDTVAIRMPDNKIALSLIKISGVPIAAPSANISGKPSPTLAKHVIRDLKGKIDCIIDGGSARIGVESTVLDLTTKPATLLRPGGVTLEALKKVLGEVNTHNAAKGNKIKGMAKSPGMKYSHYSPDAKVILLEGNRTAVKKNISTFLNIYRSQGKKVEVMDAGSLSHDRSARELFKNFRDLDDKGVDIILASCVDEKYLGLAIMNRLRKAASKIVKV